MHHFSIGIYLVSFCFLSVGGKRDHGAGGKGAEEARAPNIFKIITCKS